MKSGLSARAPFSAPRFAGRGGLFAGCALLFAGCAPLAHGGRAHVLPHGETELSLGPELTLLGTKMTREGVTLPSMQLSAGLHQGIADRVEIGARVWGFSIARAGLESWGAAVDGKIQLRRGVESGAGVDVAIAPSIGYHQLRFGGTPEHVALVSVPVLLGWKMGARNQLVVGPRAAWQAWWGESQKAQRHLFLGGSVAFAWAFGARWTFVPELVLLSAPVRFGGEAGPEGMKGATYLSVGLGFGRRF